MVDAPKILLLNFPNPPNKRLWRDTAGGFGTAVDYLSTKNQKIEAPFHPFFSYASSDFSKSGFVFEILDCQKLQFDNHATINAINKIMPDYIISVLSLPSLENDCLIINSVKESLPEVSIIGVGTVCTVIPDEVMQKSKIDFLIRNTYPYVFNLIKLINALVYSSSYDKISNISYRIGNTFVHNPKVTEFYNDEFPVPCYDSLDLDGYETTILAETGKRCLYIPIIESIGCPHTCNYCPYPIGFGKKIMFRSPEAIVDEIEYLQSTHNINAFLLRGQSFLFNAKRANKICNELIKKKLDVMWFCEARVDEVSKSLLTQMGKAGCKRIHYGVETGDPKTLETAKAGVKLNVTQKAFKISKEAGMVTQAHVILGWPDDDYKSLKITKKFLLGLKPDFINLNFLTPYPGTKMYEIAKKLSLILTYDWSNYTSHNVVMRTKSLDASELYSIKRQIIRSFSMQQFIDFLQTDLLSKNDTRMKIDTTKKMLRRIFFPSD